MGGKFKPGRRNSERFMKKRAKKRRNSGSRGAWQAPPRNGER